MRLKSIITEKDFITYAPTGLAKVADATTIAANSYAWNDTLKAIHVNDASAGVIGYFRLPVGFLKSGDIVTISADFKNVSGVKGKIALDYSTTSILGYGTGTLKQTSSVNDGTGGFETIELTFAVASDGYYSVPFGTTTADIGEFYMRNCVVKCKTNYNSEQKLYKRASRDYLLSVTDGACVVLDPYGFDTATFAIDSTAKKITLTHSKPFVIKAGVPFAQVDQSGNSPLYRIHTRSANIAGCAIYIYDVATSTLQDPALVTTLVFGMFFAGYDGETELI